MTTRVSALILCDHKLLLVTGTQAPYYWTPGGKIEENESPEDALRRELKEELRIELRAFEPYLEYDTEDRHVLCYLVETVGIPEKDNEIDEIFWYSKENFRDNNPPIGEGMRRILIPKLIQDNIL